MEAVSTAERQQQRQQHQLRRCNTSAGVRTPRRTTEHISAISPSAYHRVNSFPNSSQDAFSPFSSTVTSSWGVGSTQRQSPSPYGSTPRMRGPSGRTQHLRARSFEQHQLEDASCSSVESLEDDFGMPTRLAQGPTIEEAQHQQLQLLVEKVASLSEQLQGCKHREQELEQTIVDLQSRLQDEQQRSSEDDNSTVSTPELLDTQTENERLQARILELERELRATMERASQENANAGLHAMERQQEDRQNHRFVAESEVRKLEEGNDMRNMRQLVQGLSYSVAAGIVVAAGVRVGLELFSKYIKRT